MASEPGSDPPADVMRPIRQSYDRIADEYARRIFGELHDKPADRELLTRFAESLRGRGPVCDLGCGPGQVGRFLRDGGATVFGLDLSNGMLAQARRLNPDLAFVQADMTALSLADGALAGIAAFYAIVNIPQPTLPRTFREMARVLHPGGLLLLAFHAGDAVLREDEIWGRPIAMDFFLFDPRAICRLLEEAGFTVDDVHEREPYAPEVEYQSRRAYILARKPA